MLSHSNKPFDKDLFDKYDEKARKAVKELFKKIRPHLHVADNSNIYDSDLVVYKDGRKIGFIEVDVSASWKGLSFPYDDFAVPLRKRKLFEKELPVIYCRCNASCVCFYLIDGREVLKWEKKEIPNKYMPKGEYFYVGKLDQDKIYCL